ncbi:unnamed protein product, partial [Arabidopsis halleri]
LGYSFLLSCPIKVLKITEFVGDIGEIVQVKHVLGKLPCLELLEVDVQARRDDKKLQIMADLLMLPELHPNARSWSSSLEKTMNKL